MLFDSTLRRELARNFGATLVVILTIVLTMMLIRTLGQAAVGRGRAAGRGAAARLHRARPPADDAGAVAVHRRRRRRSARMYRDSEMTIWFASGVGAARASCGRCCARAGRCCWWSRVLALFVWPWGNQQQRRAARALRAALRPVARRARPVPDLARRPAHLLLRARPRATPPAAATSSSSPRAASVESVTSARSGRIEIDRRRPLPGARPRASATSRTRATARRRCRASRATASLAGERVRRAARRPAAEGAADDRAAARADAPQPGRAGLAPRPGARRRQPAAARHRPVGHEPAPREQLEPAVRAARPSSSTTTSSTCRRPGSAGGRLGLGAALLAAPRQRASCSRSALLWWREHGDRRARAGAARRRRAAPSAA